MMLCTRRRKRRIDMLDCRVDAVIGGLKPCPRRALVVLRALAHASGVDDEPALHPSQHGRMGVGGDKHIGAQRIIIATRSESLASWATLPGGTVRSP